MHCRCDSCGWEGPASALEPCIRDFDERMGTASECWATFGLTILPAGECPECGCLAYIEAQHHVWVAFRDYMGHVAGGYEQGRIPGVALMSGNRLFHNARDAWQSRQNAGEAESDPRPDPNIAVGRIGTDGIGKGFYFLPEQVEGVVSSMAAGGVRLEAEWNADEAPYARLKVFAVNGQHVGYLGIEPADGDRDLLGEPLAPANDEGALRPDDKIGKPRVSGGPDGMSELRRLASTDNARIARALAAAVFVATRVQDADSRAILVAERERFLGTWSDLLRVTLDAAVDAFGVDCPVWLVCLARWGGDQADMLKHPFDRCLKLDEDFTAGIIGRRAHRDDFQPLSQETLNHLAEDGLMPKVGPTILKGGTFIPISEAARRAVEGLEPVPGAFQALLDRVAALEARMVQAEAAEAVES